MSIFLSSASDLTFGCFSSSFGLDFRGFSCSSEELDELEDFEDDLLDFGLTGSSTCYCLFGILTVAISKNLD